LSGEGYRIAGLQGYKVVIRRRVRLRLKKKRVEGNECEIEIVTRFQSYRVNCHK